LALAQALSTISSVNVQASSAIVGARIEAMSAIKFALIITFSILGSSLISILSFYLLQRHRRVRKIANELQYREHHPEEYYHKTVSERGRSRRFSVTDYSRSESRNRKSLGSKSERDWDERRYGDPEVEIPLPMRDTESKSVSVPASSKYDLPASEKRNILIYDSSEPDKPPRFRSWLTQSVRSVSSFGDFRTSKELKAAKKKEEDEIRGMAIRKAREGEERRESERKKRESDERRLRAREENEEVERKVSLRRLRQEENR
jgi:hypothetical protein